MENKNFWSFIVNPFTRIAGWQAFGAGLTIAVITAVVATMSNTALNGVLDAHYTFGITYGQSFLMQAVNIVSITMVMWLIALIFSKSFRFVDILGTMTLARAPYLLMAITGFFVEPADLNQLMQNVSEMRIPIYLIITGIIAIPIMVWSVALMYNGMKVSCNMRGPKLAVSFVIGIILAEILSKFLLTWLLTLC